MGGPILVQLVQSERGRRSKSMGWGSRMSLQVPALEEGRGSLCRWPQGFKDFLMIGGLRAGRLLPTDRLGMRFHRRLRERSPLNCDAA
jgi:hypothetical protein